MDHEEFERWQADQLDKIHLKEKLDTIRATVERWRDKCIATAECWRKRYEANALERGQAGWLIKAAELDQEANTYQRVLDLLDEKPDS